MKLSQKTLQYSEADTFVVAVDYYDVAPFKPSKSIVTSYGYFMNDGSYRIARGFLFSANFPAINTEDSRRGSAVHDFFYCLMRDGYISRELRYDVDYLFYNILLEDDMPSFRAWCWFKAVRAGGDEALDAPAPKIMNAPPEPAQPAGWQIPNLFGRH